MAIPWMASSPCCASKRRREVLDSDARATGHDDDIGLGVKRLEDRHRARRAPDREIDETAVALDEGGEHRSVGVGDSITRAAANRMAAARCRSPPTAPAAG